MTKTLGQAVEFLSGGTPRKNVPAFWGGDIPWYSAKNMNMQFLGETDVTITRQGLDSGSRIAPKGSTLLLVRGSGLFKHIPICYCERDVSFNQDVKALRPLPGNDPMFIYYWLQSLRPQLRANLETTGIGAGKIDLDFLKSLPFPSFDYKQQQEIGELASVFDIKIELNRRMNETLEAMARAIFKDWFVEFGPTRAKMEGRAPYLAPELWELFPDSLDEEGKPFGWQRRTLAALAHAPRRSVNPVDIAEDTPYIGLKHMPRHSIALSKWESAGNVKSNKSIFKHGDLLFGKLRPYFHKVGLAPLDGICSSDIVVVVPRAPEWEAFTLACLSSDEFVDYTDQTSTGTKMPRTSWKTMGQYKVCVPSGQVIYAFQNLVRPLLDLIAASIHETHSLAQTRDLLLPKLMSGEIHLAQAETIIE